MFIVNKYVCFRPKVQFDMSTSWMVNEDKSSPIQSTTVKSELTVTSSSSAAGLPIINNGEAEQVFRFYWLDAYEDYKHPGIYHLQYIRTVLSL